MPGRLNQTHDHDMHAHRCHGSPPGVAGREPTDWSARPGPDRDRGAGAHSAYGAVGFVGLTLPVAGAAGLYLIARADEYGDYTPGPGPRLGWPLPVKCTGLAGTGRYAWCGERRDLANQPDNPAASTLAAWLGHADPGQRAGLRGDLLLAGITADGAPTDIPTAAVAAAVGAGLLTTHARTWPSPHARPARIGLHSMVAR